MMGKTAPSGTDEIPQLIDELTGIRGEMAQAAAVHRTTLSGLHPDWQTSGRNLIRYPAPRRHDVRTLQRPLVGPRPFLACRSESSVLASIDAVLRVLHRLDGRDKPPFEQR